MNIEIGLRVQILPYAEYRNKYTDFVGTIEKIHGNNSMMGIKLDNLENPNSSYGLFWFSKDHIRVIDNKEENLMLKGYITVGVKFIEGSNTDSEYYYACYDTNIAIDDIVVVQSGHHGLGIAKISKIFDEETDLVKCGREIVDKIDFSAYEERRAKAKKLTELKQSMDKKVKEFQARAIYEMIAEKDPEMKTLYNEFMSMVAPQTEGETLE